MKVFGPYLRKDGRKHVVIQHDNGKKQTQSYPRFLMEEYLGRKLLPEETVDHIDNDKTNNAIENLQILSLTENIQKAQKRNPRKIFKFVCPQCGQPAEKYLNEVLGNRKKARAGPFCSRSCAGKATYVNPWAK